MTRETKLRVHLEQIILDDLPMDTPVNAAQMEFLCSRATPEQKQRAFERALRAARCLLTRKESLGRTDER